MDHIIIQVLNIISQTAFLTFSLIIVSRKLTNILYSKKRMALASLLIFAANILAFFIKMFFPTFNTIVFIILLTMIEYFALNVPILKSLLMVLITIVITFFTESVAFYIISVISKASAQQIYENEKLFLLLILIINIINYSIILIYMRITNKKQFAKEMFTSDYQLLKIILLLLISTLPQIILFVVKGYSYPKLLLVINIIQMTLFCLVLFSYLKANLQKEKAESDLEISELHNKTMVNMVDGVRTLKHDYNNIMQALNGYVSTKQYDKLQEHINKVLEECNIVNNLSLIDPKIFNDPAIYGIVGAKYFMAIEADIKFEFDIVTNIKEISFSMPELSRILGILLDNAIEATLKSENKYVKLEMKYDNRKEADIIKIYNTYDTSINIDLKEIYEKGVSSKKVKSGIGLWEVKKLVKKSKNSQIFASLEHDMFVQNLIIEKTS